MTNAKGGEASHGSGLPYKAVTMYADNKMYANKLATAIRHIEGYSAEKLETKGIVKGGKVNAEGIWNYINHVAKPLLGGRNLDANDPGYLASFLAVKAAVEQYGRHGITPDLLERLVATYQQTSTQYVGQKDVQFAGSLPTEEGKAGVRKIAQITGQDRVLGHWIDSANDPSDVANRKGALEEPLRRLVEEAIATGTLESIVAEAQGGAHTPH